MAGSVGQVLFQASVPEYDVFLHFLMAFLSSLWSCLSVHAWSYCCEVSLQTSSLLPFLYRELLSCLHQTQVNTLSWMLNPQRLTCLSTFPLATQGKHLTNAATMQGCWSILWIDTLPRWSIRTSVLGFSGISLVPAMDTGEDSTESSLSFCAHLQLLPCHLSQDPL